MTKPYQYLASYGSLLLFALMCLSWSLIALPLSAVLPPVLGRRLGRFCIRWIFRLYAHWLELIGAYRLDVSAIAELRHSGPLILAPNHPSLIDAVMIAAYLPDVTCIMKAELMGNLLLGPAARLARYIRNDSPHQMVRAAIADLARGHNVLLFPEGTRTTREPINTLSKSIGVIARHARVPVQTLLIETDSTFLRKGCGLWTPPSLPIVYRVRLGHRFDPPQDAATLRLELEHYYRSELEQGMRASRSRVSSCQ